MDLGLRQPAWKSYLSCQNQCQPRDKQFLGVTCHLMPTIPDSATCAGPAIHHYDLYRLTEPHDLLRLDLPSSFTQAVSLVEWPERLQDQPPPQHLAVHLSVIQAVSQ